MDDYVCITVLSKPDESELDFGARLSRLWTRMLRGHKADFERVYAETAKFEPHKDRLSRKYLAHAAVVPVLEAELAAAELEHEPNDLDDRYTKYEACPPDWMQIEH